MVLYIILLSLAPYIFSFEGVCLVHTDVILAPARVKEGPDRPAVTPIPARSAAKGRDPPDPLDEPGTVASRVGRAPGSTRTEARMTRVYTNSLK